MVALVLVYMHLSVEGMLQCRDGSSSGSTCHHVSTLPVIARWFSRASENTGRHNHPFSLAILCPSQIRTCTRLRGGSAKVSGLSTVSIDEVDVGDRNRTDMWWQRRCDAANRL